MDELNDIVFSKTFQPPSAWADRERKYKMEKHDWETDVRCWTLSSSRRLMRLGCRSHVGLRSSVVSRNCWAFKGRHAAYLLHARQAIT